MSTSESLNRDIACIACGYNLRGMRPAGDCPECGAGVVLSIEAFEWFTNPAFDERANTTFGALLSVSVAIMATLLLMLLSDELMSLGLILIVLIVRLTWRVGSTSSI